tara:strand:- start:3488 stop:3949 length:462 start_codon:yes stop_codon:yes gene_type:complete
MKFYQGKLTKNNKNYSIKEFTVFSDFLDKISSRDKLLINCSTLENIPSSMSPLFLSEGVDYLYFRDLNTSLFGFIKGNSLEIKRFYEEYNKYFTVEDHSELNTGLKIYIPELKVIGEIEFISKNKPYPIVVQDINKKESYSFNFNDYKIIKGI